MATLPPLLVSLLSCDKTKLGRRFWWESGLYSLILHVIIIKLLDAVIAISFQGLWVPQSRIAILISRSNRSSGHACVGIFCDFCFIKINFSSLRLALAICVWSFIVFFLCTSFLHL